MEIEEVTSTEALEGLDSEWSDLWERCPTATPFQTPEWLIPWWRHVGEGDLRTLAVREGGRLVGLAPLYIYTQTAWSSSRDVFPLGIATTDYLDVLAEPGSEAAVMERVFAHLDANRERWDVLDFQDLRAGSPVLEATPPPGWGESTEFQEPCPVLTLSECEEGLSRCVPARLLHNLRYYAHRAEKVGPLTVESAHEDNWKELYDALLRLHRARWETRGEPGVLADESVVRAHREAMPGLLDRGLLRLYGLRIGGRLAACFYGFTDTVHPVKRAYYYLSGFDPEFAHLSPGTLVIGHAVREAVREGASEFDFLRGKEDYKYLWGAKDQWNQRRRFWHGG